ncbi:unnamed protein product [Acanthoscelides obtectus]|uniref:Uncharacterized protein n=1 Tax=Acanthoscelides obtectus TaxID=200917 RepID=A0A9P0P8U8_ACAOB|nr:unnamed protein product [Acanthoscelides obtectus]CAK1624807.1 Tetratricopeptide repeat protein 8 [Acanthoscelides obtectus]
MRKKINLSDFSPASPHKYCCKSRNTKITILYQMSRCTIFQLTMEVLRSLRVLAMGAHSPELYNNLGLCCLYAQQLDLIYPCFQRALELAIDPLVKAEIWYNLSYVALTAGDVQLAVQCLNVCLSADASHASALNNLAVLYHKTGKTSLTKAYLTSATTVDPNLPEPQINLEILLND